MMMTVLLDGHLRARFGERFTLAASTPAMAIGALIKTLPGFQQYLDKHSEPGFHVLVGKQDLALEDLTAPQETSVVRLIPAVVGASAGFRTILGAALIVVGAYFGQAWAMSMGISMVLGGVAEMLTKPPSFNPSALDKGPSDMPSYAFQGPHMTTGQGNCVPLGYGRCRVAGALVSLGISPETWTVNGLGGAAPDEVGTRGGNGDTSPWIWAVAPVAG